MKLTLTCIVICLAYVITCQTSPANGRPHLQQVHSVSSRSKSDSGSDSYSRTDSDMDSESSRSKSDSGSDSYSPPDSDMDSESSSGSAFDPCSTSPCTNGGSCIAAGSDFSCDCPHGYIGKTCEEFDPCSTNPCLNGGTCFDVGSDFNCSCPDSYFGKSCEAFDPCSTNPCTNGGSCNAAGSVFSCDCPHGYIGKTCEEFDPCSTNPCKNGGTCFDVGSEFNCSCPDRFVGKSCEEFEPCPSRWVFYNGSCYFFSQEVETWEAARNACIVYGAFLIVVENQQEQDFISSQTSKFSDHWLGANDIENEDIFVWDYTGEYLTFTNWYIGFQSDDEKDCIYHYSYPGDSYDGWDDYYCFESMNYICEMEAFSN